MLINDLDKLMEEMGEKQQRNRLIDPSKHHTAGILLPPEEECNTSIEPCTGLLEEYSALVGDISEVDDNDNNKENDNKE